MLFFLLCGFFLIWTFYIYLQFCGLDWLWLRIKFISSDLSIIHSKLQNSWMFLSNFEFYLHSYCLLMLLFWIESINSFCWVFLQMFISLLLLSLSLSIFVEGKAAVLIVVCKSIRPSICLFVTFLLILSIWKMVYICNIKF